MTLGRLMIRVLLVSMRLSIHIREQRALGAALLALLVGFAPAAVSWGATDVVRGSDPTKTVIRGMLVTPVQVFEGAIVIERDELTCVDVTCSVPNGATVITTTDTYIFPGFIDAHNHVAYNVLAKWSPPKVYANRGQWQSSAAYRAFKAPWDQLKASFLCEMIKYGEVKALLSGVTTIQGTAPDRVCFDTLIRNVENRSGLGLTADHIRTFILDISSFRGPVDWSRTKSLVIHLAEGIDERSRREFQTLKQKGLLTRQTAIIHGTAFGQAEFREMADVGAKLIWSPKSNLALYQQTTKIDLARHEGVEVSLGVDWNPTGSNHIFDELRTATEVNRSTFDTVIAEDEWIHMVTVNPARALAVEDRIGRLAERFKADITILRAQDGNPHRSLMKSHLQDVEMVWVGGNLLYGNDDVVAAVKPTGCEALVVKGARKRVCVAVPNRGQKREQTLAEIRRLLIERYPALAPLTQ
jgi:5-methylthioadenosine/S-adenosylhomocysteine deaminase